MHEDSYIDRSEGSDLGGLTSGHSNHLVDQVPADSQLEGVISDHFRDHMYHVSSAAFVVGDLIAAAACTYIATYGYDDNFGLALSAMFEGSALGLLGLLGQYHFGSEGSDTPNSNVP
ncbi:hypothetical protein HOC01_06370 [archaeon]|jgi:hypothetical protein|nr:hypothetical protein [archaeon]MBT6697534.1 hypothetical protein [archaeon]